MNKTEKIAHFMMVIVMMCALLFLVLFSITSVSKPILDDGVHYLDDPIEQQMIDFMHSMKKAD